MLNKVSITQAIRICVHRIQYDPTVSILLIGPPGVAKTAMARQIAKRLYRVFSGIKIAHKTPEMLGGYPYREDTLKFSDPGEWWPRQPGTLLFVDEVGQAPIATQNVIMSLPETHRMGDHELPEDTVVMMAANGSNHRAGSIQLTTAFMSRFDLVLDIDPTKSEWIDWAIENNLHASLIAGVKTVFDGVVDFDPKAKGGFLTLRTLEQASKAIYAYDGDANNPDLKVCLYSCLGDKAAATILGFMESIASLPDYDGILADPMTAKVEPAMVEPIGKTIASNIKYAHVPKVVRYVTRYPEEQQAALVTMLPESVSDHPDITALSETLMLID